MVTAGPVAPKSAGKEGMFVGIPGVLFRSFNDVPFRVLLPLDRQKQV